LNIVFVSADSAKAGFADPWRGLAVARAIARTKRHNTIVIALADFLQNSGEIQLICSAADVIVIQAKPDADIIAMTQRWRARDKVVVIDLELAICDQDGVSTRPLYNFLLNIPEQFGWGLRLVDALTLPSGQFKSDFDSFTRAYVIPEYIELDQYTDIAPAQHQGIILGYKGTSFDENCVQNSGVLEAVARVCLARPEVRVACWGTARGVFKDFGIPVVEDFDGGHHLIDKWPWPLAYVDIGLAPLSGPIDARQGWSVPLEFMAMRIPWIGTFAPAYYELQPYGRLVDNTGVAWERGLLEVIDHLPFYHEEVQSEPYLFALSQGLDENIETILSTFTEIMDSCKQNVR
jgi:hypothetical protein